MVYEEEVEERARVEVKGAVVLGVRALDKAQRQVAVGHLCSRTSLSGAAPVGTATTVVSKSFSDVSTAPPTR